MDIPENLLDFIDRTHWREWLHDNHATATEAWIIITKKKFEAQGIGLNAAVEQALCYGWIDGVMKSLDERSYALRFSPRKRDSIWSISNIRRVEKLIAEGQMTDAGLAKIQQAKANGQWVAAIERERVDVIPETLEAALQQVDGALAAYQSLPDSRKKQFIYWLQSAKREQTKARRIQKIIDEVTGV